MNIEEHAYENYLQSGDVFYDIGAHIGAVTCRFTKKADTIYAFEPSPFNFPELEKNTIGMNNVSCFQVAFHEKEYECETEFRDCSENRLNKEKDEKQNIKYVRLDNFIRDNNLKPPNFIKMDIEGMESIVLKTCVEMMASFRPIFFVEIHAQAKQEKNQNYKDNPHWVWPEDDGFNFNILKILRYRINTANGYLPADCDWNPKSGSHCGYILIPS